MNNEECVWYDGMFVPKIEVPKKLTDSVMQEYYDALVNCKYYPMVIREDVQEAGDGYAFVSCEISIRIDCQPYVLSLSRIRDSTESCSVSGSLGEYCNVDNGVYDASVSIINGHITIIKQHHQRTLADEVDQNQRFAEYIEEFEIEEISHTMISKHTHKFVIEDGREVC